MKIWEEGREMRLVITMSTSLGYSLFLNDDGKIELLIENRNSLAEVCLFCTGFQKIFPDIPIEFLPALEGFDFQEGKKTAEEHRRKNWVFVQFNLKKKVHFFSTDPSQKISRGFMLQTYKLPLRVKNRYLPPDGVVKNKQDILKVWFKYSTEILNPDPKYQA